MLTRVNKNLRPVREEKVSTDTNISKTSNDPLDTSFVNFIFMNKSHNMNIYHIIILLWRKFCIYNFWDNISLLHTLDYHFMDVSFSANTWKHFEIQNLDLKL